MVHCVWITDTLSGIYLEICNLSTWSKSMSFLHQVNGRVPGWLRSVSVWLLVYSSCSSPTTECDNGLNSWWTTITWTEKNSKGINFDIMHGEGRSIHTPSSLPWKNKMCSRRRAVWRTKWGCLHFSRDCAVYLCLFLCAQCV